MYPTYFGLKEASFSITPDPHYLFLSRRHREALAHLLYGTGEGGGFVLLTGEVGTGKTTVCRAFLEQLPGEVDVALILNPALTGPELLQAICHEFHVEVPPEVSSAKVLVDRLNAYLLEAHGAGRRPVLLIDEAQNLAPEVLEQIRLLTNLETAKHKLLQIFLVGQPELRDLLGRRDLRQLAQRITARYHLNPLDAQETADYIRHRLAVAGVDRPLFTRGALRRIHSFSGGVPRLVNILCDRSLLGAYATRRARVDRRIVARAVRELRGELDRPAWGGSPWRVVAAALSLFLAAGGGWLAYGWTSGGIAWPVPWPWTPAAQVVPPAAESPAAPEVVADPVPEVVPPDGGPVPAAGEEPDAAAALPAPVQSSGPAFPVPGHLFREPRDAMALLLGRWGLRPPDGPANDLCRFAESGGLLCRREKGGWGEIRRFGLPAVLTLIDDAGTVGEVLVTGLDDTRVRLEAEGEPALLDRADLDPYWDGAFLMVWRPAPGGRTLVAAGSPEEAVRWLRQTLAAVPGLGVSGTGSGVFDPSLREAVQAFQRREGLAVDGIAGPETLIRLIVAAALPGIPRLDALH